MTLRECRVLECRAQAGLGFFVGLFLAMGLLDWGSPAHAVSWLYAGLYTLVARSLSR